MSGAAVEIDHRDHPRPRIGVHPRRGVGSPGGERVWIGQFDLDRIAGELGARAGEDEAAGLAHQAAAAVASDQPSAMQALAPGLDSDSLVRLVEALDFQAAPDLGAHGGRPLGEDRFESVHVNGQGEARRARQSIPPTRGVDILVEELDACEMARGAAGRLHPVRRGLGGAGGRVDALCGFNRGQEVAAIEGFERRRGQAAHAERQPLQRRPRIRSPFEDHHGNPGKSELAGEEEPNRAGAGDNDVMGGGMMDRHGRSLVEDVRPERSSSLRPRGRTTGARQSVQGSPWGSQARSQRPELSLPKGFGLTRPNLPFPTPVT